MSVQYIRYLVPYKDKVQLDNWTTVYSTRYDNLDRVVLIPSPWLEITHINADQLPCTCNGSTKRLEQESTNFPLVFPF